MGAEIKTVEKVINELVDSDKEVKIRKFKKDVLQTYWPIIGQVILKKEYHKDQISEILINYFCSTSEEYFTELTTDKQKGVMMFGNVGVGKTVNFKIYEKIYSKLSPEIGGVKYVPLSYINNDAFLVLHVDDIKRGVKNQGDDYLERLSRVRNLVIDEFGGGEHEDINDFGTKSSPVIELINARYRKTRELKLITHFTTNLTKQEMFKKYGERIYDRLKEMCLFIAIEGESKRV